MELYTWPEDRIMVLLQQEEWKKNGWDPYEGNISTKEAEIFFSTLFQIVCEHFYMEENIQLNAEISHSSEGTMFLIIECLDETGSKLSLRQHNSIRSGMIFRFAKKDDLVSFADRAKANHLKGGTFVVFYPCYYLLFDELGEKNSDKLVMLLEEYGERSYLDPVVVRNKGEVIKDKSALQYIASGYR